MIKHWKWQVYQGAGFSGRLLFTFERKILSLRPTVLVYLNDGDRIPDFEAVGTSSRSTFEILDKRNGARRVLAQSSLQRRTASYDAYFNQILELQTYVVEIEANVDTAFIATLSLLLDELYND